MEIASLVSFLFSQIVFKHDYVVLKKHPYKEMKHMEKVIRYLKRAYKGGIL